MHNNKSRVLLVIFAALFLTSLTLIAVEKSSANQACYISEKSSNSFIKVVNATTKANLSCRQIMKASDLTAVAEIVSDVETISLSDSSDFDQNLVEQKGLEDYEFKRYKLKITDVLDNNTDRDYQPEQEIYLMQLISTDPYSTTCFDKDCRGVLEKLQTGGQYLLFLSDVDFSNGSYYISGSSDYGILNGNNVTFTETGKSTTLTKLKYLIIK